VTTKLTLKIDENVIKSAKKYAHNRKTSLSRLVEDYFRRLISKKERENGISPLVEELSGIITEKDLAGMDYAAYLEKKYE
jgi:hypothetical protein